MTLMTAALLLGGCIYHEHKHIGTGGGTYDTWNDWEDWGDDDDDVGDDDDDDDDNTGDTELWLEPSNLATGEVHIVSLLASDPILDEADELELLNDDITLLAWTLRTEQEVVLTLDVPADTPAGDIDLLVWYQSGSADIVRDALSVVPAVQ